MRARVIDEDHLSEWEHVLLISTRSAPTSNNLEEGGLGAAERTRWSYSKSFKKIRGSLMLVTKTLELDNI